MRAGVVVIAEALRIVRSGSRIRSLGIRRRDGPVRGRARFGGRDRGFRRESGRRWCGWGEGRDSYGGFPRRSVRFAAGPSLEWRRRVRAGASEAGSMKACAGARLDCFMLWRGARFAAGERGQATAKTEADSLRG